MSPKMTDKRAQILIVTPDFSGPTRNGGIGTATFHQAAAFSGAGHKVTILFTGHNEYENPAHWAKEFWEKYGWEYHDLVEWANEHAPATAKLPPFYGLPEMNWSYQTLLFMKTRSYDVVYFQDWLSCGLRPMQYKQAGLGFEDTRFVLTLHSYHQWIWEGMEVMPASMADMVRQSMEVAAIRLADALIAPSRHMAAYTQENVRNLNTPIEVIPYGLSSHEIRSDGKVKYGPFDHLVFFGRLETRKGLRLFLDAVSQSSAVAGKIRTITFLGRQGSFEGSPAKEGIVKAMYGLQNIRWEFVEDLDFSQALAWLKGRENILVAAPSLLDNLPLAIIELFTNHIPFVTTDAGGITEIIGKENRGIIVERTANALRAFFDRIIGIGELEIDHGAGYDAKAALAGNLSFLDLQMALLQERQQPIAACTHKSPALSVLVPHFNSTTYLKNALDTLKEQDIAEDFEVIVVDDCSTNQAEVAEFDRIAATWPDSRVRFIKSTINRGPSGTRNFAASYARADYLVFFDCDNEAAPNMLRTMHKAVVNSGLDFFTIFTFQIIQPDSANPRKLDRDRIIALYTPIGPALEVGAFVNVFGDACCIMKRSAFEAVGGFSSKYGSYEDWEIFATLCFKGFRMGVIPEPLMYYRNMDDGFSKTTSVYRNRMRILTRYATPEGVASLNWLEVLKLATGSLNQVISPQGKVEASVYNYFSKLGEAEIRSFLFNDKPGGFSTPLSETLWAMRKALKPVLARCLLSPHPPQIMIYGIGEHTSVLLGTNPILADYVVGFIDRRPCSEFLGRPCIRPEEMTEEIAAIIVYSSRAFEKQMYGALKQLRLEHILIYNKIDEDS
jgi:O-antigen biosynthesis protein